MSKNCQNFVVYPKCPQFSQKLSASNACMLATFSMSAPPQTQHNTAHRPPPLDVFVAFPYDSLFAAVATEDLFKEMSVIHQGIISCIWYLGVRPCMVEPGLEYSESKSGKHMRQQQELF